MDSDYFLDHADRFAGAARASDDEIDREVAAIGEAIRERVDALLAEIEDRSRPATGLPDWATAAAARSVVREFAADAGLRNGLLMCRLAVDEMEQRLCGLAGIVGSRGGDTACATMREVAESAAKLAAAVRVVSRIADRSSVVPLRLYANVTAALDAGRRLAAEPR